MDVENALGLTLSGEPTPASVRQRRLRQVNLQLVATLDTHVHADHVTGAWLLKTRFDSAIAISAAYTSAAV